MTSSTSCLPETVVLWRLKDIRARKNCFSTGEGRSRTSVVSFIKGLDSISRAGVITGLILIAACILIPDHARCQVEEIIVFITRTGNTYHRDQCPEVWEEKIPVRLTVELLRKYSPCGKCSPPLPRGADADTLRSIMLPEPRSAETRIKYIPGEMVPGVGRKDTGVFHGAVGFAFGSYIGAVGGSDFSIRPERWSVLAHAIAAYRLSPVTDAVLLGYLGGVGEATLFRALDDQRISRPADEGKPLFVSLKAQAGIFLQEWLLFGIGHGEFQYASRDIILETGYTARFKYFVSTLGVHYRIGDFGIGFYTDLLFGQDVIHSAIQIHLLALRYLD